METSLDTGFASELSWKVFLDRYTQKDLSRSFTVGDLAIAVVEPHPKWPKKDIGRVLSVDHDTVTLELLTGPQKGDTIVRQAKECDRPIERTLGEVAQRIAAGVAAVEKSSKRKAAAQDFARELSALRLVPGGRIWTAAGTDQQLTYFNCFVIDSPKDSRGGIVDTLKQMIEIMSRGGGVGFNISSLRPAHAVVRGVNGRSSGAVSWMDLYSRATGLVEQAGSRRGALMLQIEDWHPDVADFVNVKKTPGMVENANISVRISDAFMTAVKADGDWDLVFPDTTDPEYDSLWDGNLEAWKAAGKPVVHYETIKARKLWDAIIEGAWQAAEPGLIFDERTERESNSWYFNPLIATNPCGEEPLPADGVCTLGHVNLALLYDPETQDVDWEQLRTTVQVGVRFLDDIVDATPYFYEGNRANQQRERRIGLGTLGLGELLIRLGLRYGSPESITFIDRLYRFIATEAYLYDTQLAAEKGAFPAFDADQLLQSGFMQRMPEAVREAVRDRGLRNVTILTQAPTGTTGTMVGTSTGIEPFYALTYMRQSRLGFDAQHVAVAQEWLDAHPGQTLPDYFVGAMDLTPEEHVRVQAAIQRWTDASISKTANAPSTYTVEDTRRLYGLAYDLGCKGVTIYRDQSRQEQVLHTVEASTSEPAAPAPVPDVEVYPLPSEVSGRTYRKETPAGTARVVINEVEGQPFEVFMLLGRAGSEVQSFTEALGRIISLYLRSNGQLSPRRRLELVADQLTGIGGANQMGFGVNKVLSVVDGIGKLFDGYLKSEPAQTAESETAATITRNSGHAMPTYEICNACGAAGVVHENGCSHCTQCSWSRC